MCNTVYEFVYPAPYLCNVKVLALGHLECMTIHRVPFHRVKHCLENDHNSFRIPLKHNTEAVLFVIWFSVYLIWDPVIALLSGELCFMSRKSWSSVQMHRACSKERNKAAGSANIKGEDNLVSELELCWSMTGIRYVCKGTSFENIETKETGSTCLLA